MDSHQLKDLATTKAWLEDSGNEFEWIEHPAVPTVADMVEHCKFEKETTLAKNLFLKDKKKKNLYLVVAQHDTEVDLKVLAEHLGTGKSNLRGGDEKDMLEILGCKPGSVNLFSLMNDTEEKVKVLLDKKIADAERVAVHPMENTATAGVGKAFVEYVFEASSHQPDVIDFSALAEKVLKAQAEAAEAKKAKKGGKG